MGIFKSEALIAYNSGEYTGIEAFSHHGIAGMTSAVLATFAIAPWAYVGFDTIPQVAEEFKFSYKKVSVIMIVAIVFGCFIYIANNTIAAIVLDNWPELILESETFPWLLLISCRKITWFTWQVFSRNCSFFCSSFRNYGLLSSV